MSNLNGLKLIDYAGFKIIVDMGEPSFEQGVGVINVSQGFTIKAIVMNDDQRAAVEDAWVRSLVAAGIRVISASEYAVKGFTP